MRGEAVTVLTAPTTTDPYSGEDTLDWEGTLSERTVTTLAPPEPRPSDEPVLDARNAVTEGWTLYLPAGDPVTRLNRVRVRGIDYPVQGTPSAWGDEGVVVQVYRTEG